MDTNIKVYLRLISNSIQNYISYKANIFIEVITKVCIIVLQILIWKALYRYTNNMSTFNGNLDFDSMVTYVVISSMMSILLPIFLFTTISEKIQTGAIVIDLMRPISFRKYVFAQYIGTSLAQSVVQIIPNLILVLLFFKIQLPGVYYICLFLASMINSILINLLINYIIGFCAFWILHIWPIGSLYESCIRILAGSWLPLWLFPDFLQKISDFLPFKSIFFTPITIFLGKADLYSTFKLIAIQIFWIGVLFLFQQVLWITGTKRLVIQGG